MGVAKIKVESDVTNALAGLKRVDSAMGRMGKGGGGQGMLQLAQFADDAQYGIRGILNNIPGVAMGFGASAAAAGALSIAVLGIAKIMDGSAQRWGEALGSWISNGKVLDAELKKNEESAKRLFEQMRDGTRQAEDAYKGLIKQMEYSNALQKSRDDQSSTMENIKERLVKESQIGNIAMAETNVKLAPDSDSRMKAENELAKMRERHLIENGKFEEQEARNKMDALQREFDMQKRIRTENLEMAKHLAKLNGEENNENARAAKERAQAAFREMMIISGRLTGAKEEVSASVKLNKLKLDTMRIQESASGKIEQMQGLFGDFFDEQQNLRQISAQSDTVGTSLQRVGLGKTPELVLQVDLARRSEKHLSEISKTIKKLSFGLN